MKFTIAIFFCVGLVTAQVKDTSTMTIGDGPHETLAEFPGGTKNLYLFLNNNVSAKVDDLKLSESEISSMRRIVARLSISESGSVDSVTFVRRSNVQRLDSLFKTALMAMPTWKPGQLNGKNCRQNFYLPLIIDFK
jgi:hypothetical protein